MMSSETSTSPAAPAASFRPGHFYLLLAMCGATAAVMMARDTQPTALILLSAAVLAAGAAAFAMHTTVVGFFRRAEEPRVVSESLRAHLEREKLLTLRAIKDLEFDHAMGKVADVDFTELSARLRGKALDLMQQLDAAPAAPVTYVAESPREAAASIPGRCAACGTVNDADARFCKQCGAGLEQES